MLTWASDGDGREQARAVQFDGKLELGSFGATITSDAWRRPSRKRDEAFRWTEMSSTLLSDPRRGKETQHACNACFECACYHPLLLFNRHGDQKRPGVSKTARGAVHEGYSRGFRPRCCSSACRAASPMGSTRGQDRPLPLESGSPPAYDAGSRTDPWEVSVEANGPTGFENA